MNRRGFLVGSATLLTAGCADRIVSSADSTAADPTPQPSRSQRGGAETPEPIPTVEQVPLVTVVSESFDPRTLTVDVTLDVDLQGTDAVTIRRTHFADSTDSTQPISASGRHTLQGLRQGTSLQTTDGLFAHLVGSERFSTSVQGRFRELSLSSIPTLDENAGVYRRRFEYDLQSGRTRERRTFTMSIPKAAYEYCRTRPRLSGAYGFYGGDPVNDEFVRGIADELDSAHDGIEAVNAAIAFVQSLPYTDDSVTTEMDEYQRYPVETLVDEGGDCEDSAILLGSIIKRLGYGVKGVLLPGHMAIGIKGSDDLPGMYYEQSGARYYYIETTGDGWRVGEIPEVHRESSAQLVDLYGYPVLNYQVQLMGGGFPTLWYTLQNHGDAIAREVSITARYLDAGGRLVNGTRRTVALLEPDDSTRVQLPLLSPPPETPVRLHTTVAVDGQEQVEGRSEMLQ